jgi:CelD/BcsL family acetyltransferase involved in cellulose biosynthesis
MIEVLTESSQLYQLKSSWDALADLQGTPLLGFDWYVSCAETIHSRHELRIVTESRNGAVVAIAPLFIDKSNDNNCLQLMGTTIFYEPSGFLFTDQDSLARLLKGVIGLGLPLTLLRLPDDPTLLSALSKCRGIMLRRITASSAFLDLPKEWDSFLQGLSVSRRSDFRRKRRCLEKAGVVNTRVCIPSSRDFSELLQESLLVEEKSWKGREGTSVLKKPQLHQFFETYLRKACEQGVLRFCFIDIDDRPVSMHIAIQSHQALWILKLGYDEAFAKCSPGTQLAMDTIEYSVQQGLARYEFLGSEEPWQNAWPIKRRDFFTALIFPYTLRGLFGLLKFTILFSKKQLTQLFSK